MKKRYYEEPEMEIKTYSHTNIVRTSLETDVAPRPEGSGSGGSGGGDADFGWGGVY